MRRNNVLKEWRSLAPSGRGVGRGGKAFQIILFSCTPCRGAFGGKSTAKPPTHQRSHQTKNSYHSRITHHFRSSNKFGFCRLLVLFDCSLLAIVGLLTCVLNCLWGHFVFPTLLFTCHYQQVAYFFLPDILLLSTVAMNFMASFDGIAKPIPIFEILWSGL